MVALTLQDKHFEIRPVTNNDLDTILQVYRHCEDFLALGPVATASTEMVLKDLEISKDEDGIFCGIYAEDGNMIGVVDYVPNNYHGNPHVAYLSLLMIDASFRSQGIGQAVFETIEHEIKKDSSVSVLLAGVQVNNPQAITFWQRRGFLIISAPKLMPDQTTVFDLQKELR